MTVREIITNVSSKADNLTTFEIWKYTDKTERLHTDFIKNIDGEYSLERLNDFEADYFIMDESEYDKTICANCQAANFEEWYDDKNVKVLVIMLAFDVSIE